MTVLWQRHDVGNDHLLPQVEVLVPEGDHFDRQTLEVLDLGRNTLGTPFVGVVDHLAVVLEGVHPIDVEERSQLRQRLVDSVVEIVDGQRHELRDDGMHQPLHLIDGVELALEFASARKIRHRESLGSSWSDMRRPATPFDLRT